MIKMSLEELKHLINKLSDKGSVYLEGVSENDSIEGVDEDASNFSIKINGVVFTFTEDPLDGYRSSLEDIFVDAVDIKSTFQIKVTLSKKSDDYILALEEESTKFVLIEVGTDNYDDYYPNFIYRNNVPDFHMMYSKEGLFKRMLKE